MLTYDIVMYTEGLGFNGDSLNEKALGGSETAFIEVAKQLRKMGHDVIVYCRCDRTGIYDGVSFQDISDFEAWVVLGECDIFIASRFYHVFPQISNAKLKVLWNHDILTEQSSFGIMGAVYSFNYMYVLSEFHKKQYIETNPDFEPLIKLNTNAVDFNMIKKSCEGVEKKHKIMFTSRPERGLYQALDIFEALGDKELEFLACNYETVDDPDVKRIEELCGEKMHDLHKKGFKVKLGRFTKADLYKEIAESKAVIYPTNFPEISCISAMEAQACGTIFMTTKDFALPETVGYPCIPQVDEEKNYRVENYNALFGEALQNVLSDEKIRDDLEQKGLKHVAKYTWENVANTFIEDATEYFTKRSSNKKDMLERFIVDSDLELAREYATKFLPDELPRIDNMLRFVDGKADYKELYENEETHEQIDIDPDEKPNPRFKWLAKQLEKHSCKNYLDYACHMGKSCFDVNVLQPDIKVTGYDISETAIKKAKDRIDKYATKKENLEFICNEPLSEQQYDAIFFGEFLEHGLNPGAKIDELEEYVKDGGRIFFTVPRGAWEWISRDKNMKQNAYYHVQGFDKKDLKNILRNKKELKITSICCGSSLEGRFVGNYLVEYTKDGSKCEGRDVDRKAFTNRPYQSITACMIVKDAEKEIEKCLDSFYKEVDDIIIVNDHSKDDTVKRALKYPRVQVFDLDKTITEPDLAGFAYGRNFGLDKATGKWIFWIDSDEEILNFKNVRQFLDTEFINTYVIYQHHAQFDSFIKADVPNRIFRRGTGKFYGYIHEQAQSVDDINKPIIPALIMEDVNIINLGVIDEKRRRAKALDRNLPLLHKDVLENVDKMRKAGKPIRKLSIILTMRDFVNRIKWAAEKVGTYKTKDADQISMPQIIKLYNNYFKDEKDPVYKKLSSEIYQEALYLTETGVELNYYIHISKENVNLEDVSLRKLRCLEGELPDILENLKENGIKKLKSL